MSGRWFCWLRRLGTRLTRARTWFRRTLARTRSEWICWFWRKSGCSGTCKASSTKLQNNFMCSCPNKSQKMRGSYNWCRGISKENWTWTRFSSPKWAQFTTWKNSWSGSILGMCWTICWRALSTKRIPNSWRYCGISLWGSRRMRLRRCRKSSNRSFVG